MPELLFEILSEEIPARMQGQAAADLKRLVTDGLREAGLGFGTALLRDAPPPHSRRRRSAGRADV